VSPKFSGNVSPYKQSSICNFSFICRTCFNYCCYLTGFA